MKNQISILTICVLIFSCDTNSDLVTDPIIGFWSRETVYLNGVNSIEYVDFLNDGTNFLEINKDKTFFRAYDVGRWNKFGQNLNLDREESTGFPDWTYKIINHSADKLILETNLTESQYCCGFDSFADDEIITIREVYKRLN